MTAGLAAFFGVALGGKLGNQSTCQASLDKMPHVAACPLLKLAVQALHLSSGDMNPSAQLNCLILHTGSLFALEVLHRSGMQFYEVS